MEPLDLRRVWAVFNAHFSRKDHARWICSPRLYERLALLAVASPLEMRPPGVVSLHLFGIPVEPMGKVGLLALQMRSASHESWHTAGQVENIDEGATPIW